MKRNIRTAAAKTSPKGFGLLRLPEKILFRQANFEKILTVLTAWLFLNIVIKDMVSDFRTGDFSD